MSNAFAAVNTRPKVDKKTLNPRSTRYGMLFMWTVPVLAKDFGVSRIPANKVFPFRAFPGETIVDYQGRVLLTTERLPQEQITDMHTMSSHFTELPPLAELNDEDKAERIAEVLANPTVCNKYPVELKSDCLTCWFKYLLTDVDGRIAEEFKSEPEMQRAARKCVVLVRDGVSKAIEEARRRVDIAIRDIDDPKSGKLMFYPADHLNVYHTHADRPQYRTSTSNTNIGDQIASALRDFARKDEAPAADIAKLVQEAVEAATRDLREQLAAYQEKPEIAEAEVPEKIRESIKAKVDSAKKKD